MVDDEPHGLRGAVLEGSADQPEVSGVDLLVVVDHSISMADKQEVLSRSFERLTFLSRLCSPPGAGPLLPSVDGSCPEGRRSNRLVPAVRSAAVISSSLEAAGACTASSRGAHPVLSPAKLLNPTSYIDQIREVGDQGCGFEAPLEAMYRFLVDPSPPLTLEQVAGPSGQELRAQGIDEELLRQRKSWRARRPTA